jgi:hypothetical protein
VRCFGLALVLSGLSGLSFGLSGLSGLGLSALNWAAACAFAAAVMLTSSHLSSRAARSPSTTLPPRSEATVSKHRE